MLNVDALRAGETVAGNVGHVVFVAQPLDLSPAPRQALDDGLAVSDVRVLVVTRHVANPVNGVAYFVLVAGVVLLAGVVVAAVLARRISAPIVRAVDATRQMAEGNLDATVPVRPGEYPELEELADAINTLGENLGRARGLEREFLLSVSHELRTPLTSIRGYADAIAEAPPTTSPVRSPSSTARPAASNASSRTCSTWPGSRPVSSRSTPNASIAAALARTVAEGFHPKPTASASSSSASARPASRCGPTPIPTGWARSSPTSSRTP